MSRQHRKPCRECPWRRAAWRGFLGPQTPDEWVSMAHGEGRIACHRTIPDGVVEGDFERDGLKQCAGAAIYRANNAKLPRDGRCLRLPPDRETVFASPAEFKRHHTDTE